MNKTFGTRHLVAIAVAFLLGYVLLVAIQLSRDLPGTDVEAVAAPESPQAASADAAQLSIPMPSRGNAAISVGGVGLVAFNRDEQPKPLASITKMMTAYVVLHDHPLKLGEHGPEIVAEGQDVDTYKQQLANGESVVVVKNGEKYSQYDLLAGVLVPSGNNLAFMLARWSAGSQEAFVQRMNEVAAQLGMSQTHYEDPSGLSPLNVSTARDQLKLAEALMNDQVLASVVGLKQADIPGAGTVYNVNSLLGQDNLIGVKTGWTEYAGACFLFAADWPVDGQSVRIYGIVMGQDTLSDAFAATRQMLRSMGENLHVATVVTKDGPPSLVKTQWGTNAPAMPVADARVVVWPGLPVSVALQSVSVNGEAVTGGSEVGKLVVTAGGQRKEVAVASQGGLGTAGLLWRLTRLPSAPW